MSTNNKFVVNSVDSMNAFMSKVPDLYGGKNYLVFSWTTGKKSSMPQKALLNIWIRTYAAHLIRKPEKDVTKTEINTMKRSAKRLFYTETHEEWMVEEITDPFHPDKKRMEVTSAADWDPQQTYHFMMWLQERAMHQHLILESQGDHQNMTKEMTQ